MSTYVWISRQQLTNEGACREGLALFDALKAAQDERRCARGLKQRSKLRLEWSPLAYLWLESEGRRFASWMFHRGIVPMPRFGSANLSGANLNRADLGGANLYGADLGGADLSGADLSGADLSLAGLRGAHLRGAYLGAANLSGANLGGADLGGANLRWAHLRWADLGGADLSGANLGDWERGPDGYARRKP